jgi:predicted 3-demethylubiquinone-9 3-methyltransferase (glyoxalase superfamily)
MPSITPFLWFNDQAEEAMNFYLSVFKDSEVMSVNRYTEAGPGLAGSVMTATFRLNDLEFTALNGGPVFKFTEAISFVVNCDGQAEVDEYWETLSQDGHPGQCGWLKDQFGVSWQIVPKQLNDIMNGSDTEGVERATKAMLKMGKLDVAALQKAYDGE